MGYRISYTINNYFEFFVVTSKEVSSKSFISRSFEIKLYKEGFLFRSFEGREAIS
jgi:hypothetical protein